MCVDNVEFRTLNNAFLGNLNFTWLFLVHLSTEKQSVGHKSKIHFTLLSTVIWGYTSRNNFACYVVCSTFWFPERKEPYVYDFLRAIDSEILVTKSAGILILKLGILPTRVTRIPKYSNDIFLYDKQSDSYSL